MTKTKTTIHVVPDTVAPSPPISSPLTLVKPRPLLTPEDIIQYVSELIAVVQELDPEDYKIQRLANTLMNMCTVSLKAMKEQIAASPEGQIREINKVKALAAMAKGLPPSLAKQILLEKNFHLLEDLQSARDVTNSAEVQNLERREGSTKEQRDTPVTQEENLRRNAAAIEERSRLARIERASTAREQLDAQRARRQRPASDPRLLEFLGPSYSIDGSAVSTSPNPQATPDTLWPSDLSWLE